MRAPRRGTALRVSSSLDKIISRSLSDTADMSTNTNKRNPLFNKPGMHEYQGTFYLPFSPATLLREVETFEFAPGDTLIATYPKSGSYYVRGILSILFHFTLLFLMKIYIYIYIYMRV